MSLTQFGGVQGGLLASLRKENSAAQSDDINDPDNSKNVMCRFRPPFHYTDGLGGTAAVTDAAINVLTTADGGNFAVRVEQAFSGTAPQVAVHARGALLKIDASAADDGIGLDLGYGASASEIPNSAGAFVIGTDQPFYLRVRLEVGDVSDADQVAVGFVKGGWVDDGTLDTYTDYAALNIDNGDIKIETRLNSGSASVTDTTQDVADYASTGDVYDLEIRVNKSGKVNFLINGAEPTVDVTNFTFDSGDTVNAIVAVIGDTVGGDPTVVIHEWESGYLSSRGLSDISDVTVGL